MFPRTCVRGTYHLFHHSEPAATCLGGDETLVMARVPANSTMAIPTIPIRSENNPENRAKSPGARNEAARPVVAYRPNISPSRPGGATWARKDRELDWAGPTHRHRISPKIQNIVTPCANSRIVAVPISTPREIRITLLGPIQSSILPSTSAPTAATTLAAIPKMSTVSDAIPYTVTARIAP